MPKGHLVVVFFFLLVLKGMEAIQGEAIMSKRFASFLNRDLKALSSHAKTCLRAYADSEGPDQRCVV